MIWVFDVITYICFTHINILISVKICAKISVQRRVMHKSSIHVQGNCKSEHTKQNTSVYKTASQFFFHLIPVHLTWTPKKKKCVLLFKKNPRISVYICKIFSHTYTFGSELDIGLSIKNTLGLSCNKGIFERQWKEKKIPVQKKSASSAREKERKMSQQF